MIFDLKTGWTGSAALGFECLVFLPCAVCIDLFGSRKVAIFGACLQTIGLLASSFVNALPMYLFTHSFMFGCGKGLLAEATFQILPHYFDKHLGFANGLMNFGGSIIAIGFLLTTSRSLDLFGLKKTFLIFACLTSTTIIASLSFKSVLDSKSQKTEKITSKLKESFGLEVLKRPEFTIWWVSACFYVICFAIATVTIVIAIFIKYIDLYTRLTVFFVTHIFSRTITRTFYFQIQMQKS
jgi:MFS family permease